MILSAVRAIWWIGLPLAFLLWLLAPRESVIYVSFEPFSIESNTLQTTLHPILGELVAGYRRTAVALALMIVVTVVSHRRRTNAVRTFSLLLPSYVAAYEACIHFSSFGSRHHYTYLRTLDEIQHEFHMAAIASVIAVAAPLVVAAVLYRRCRHGVTGGVMWPALVAVAPLASVVILWLGFERILFWRGPPGRVTRTSTAQRTPNAAVTIARARALLR